jgi:hypothetical protein
MCIIVAEKNWAKTFQQQKNKPDTPRAEAAGTFYPISEHNSLQSILRDKNSTHLQCTFCTKENTAMNKDHLLQCQGLSCNTRKAPLAMLYLAARGSHHHYYYAR